MPALPGTAILEAIAANVQRWRVRRGWSQAELAEHADMDLRQLQRIERGMINFGVVILVKLAKALDAPPGTLLRPAKLDAAKRGRPPERRRSRSSR